MSEMKYQSPVVNPETKPFWDATAEGKFLLKKCNDCGEFHYYPRALCPFCFSDKTEWVESKGTGTVYTHSTMRRAPVPFCLAYVTLDEGPTMMTHIVDCDLEQVAIGKPVKLVLKETDGDAKLPCFTLA
ncbi:MAG: Zn-ribbon domain-containing OB-fold protein [Pseudomonadota bacterium]|nr:Zn-ribbon domain-containing OB-fold protein [Pseudomonadota bacterium]